MRQVFFLLIAAMIVAFSLSWASPSLHAKGEYILPDQVILPARQMAQDQLEISSTVSLRDHCEKVGSIRQDLRGDRIILSVRAAYVDNPVCLEHVRRDFAVNFIVDRLPQTSTGQLDVYFRESEENLKYFGSISVP